MQTACATQNPLIEPDCVRCLQKKLRAIGAVTFFQDGGDRWRLGCFQGDTPSSETEVIIYALMHAKIPEIVWNKGSGFYVNNVDMLKRIFPPIRELFQDHVMICAPVQYKHLTGVRIAWRDKADEFTLEELNIIECQGNCPTGCI
ncbi:MAG: hypothetical protein IT292_08465 [Deltaproteobacteria bacterium]|nr:hypothetical protein [Deltaproteobacteria bacterium]